MYISKIVIENFKCYSKFSVDFADGPNILVGNNEAGKSTILEAIHLALTGLLNGRYLRNELSQYLFNRNAEQEYISSLTSEYPKPPPEIRIELYFKGEPDDPLAIFEGNGNSDNSDDCGLSFTVEFDDQYSSEYAELVRGGEIKTIPIEYYTTTWTSFARQAVTSKTIPIKSALIDSSAYRMQNGSDLYISRIIRENLEDKERVDLSQAHRQMKEGFMNIDSIKAINEKISASADISSKSVKISVDLSTQHAWELSLMTYLDDIPFHLVGKGEQSIIKTNMAMNHKKAKEANVVLLEEPENHLSFASLNVLLEGILRNMDKRQLIVSTHSSFVANKLGLDSLLLINKKKCTKLTELSDGTRDFFKKLSGYDTLRLLLCKRAVLVEGDSDELIYQKAYLSKHGKLPIQDGVDVISVGTSFLRFLEIADKINVKVSVITDTDGDIKALEKKYANYLGKNAKENIQICYDGEVDSGPLDDFNYNTLEPKLLKINGRAFLNSIFSKPYATDEELLKYMHKNKTECALAIFDFEGKVNYPKYILEAI